MIKKKDIRKLSKDQLIDQLVAMGEKKFRAKQVYEWLWKKGAHSFEEMTNLSKGFRNQLEEYFVINNIFIIESKYNCARLSNECC